MPATPRASCAARKRAPMRATGSPAPSAGWSEVPWVPASAAPWARSRACSAFPTMGGIGTATAITTATGASTVTGELTLSASILQTVASFEDPPHHDHADDEECHRHAEAQGDADVGDLVKAPAEAGDQVDDGIEQRDGAPARGQHVDGVEAAAEEGQRRHH